MGIPSCGGVRSSHNYDSAALSVHSGSDGQLCPRDIRNEHKIESTLQAAYLIFMIININCSVYS